MNWKHALGIAGLVLLTIPLVVATIALLQSSGNQPEASCGNRLMEQGESPQNCCEDTGRLPAQSCVNHSCIEVKCGECEYVANNSCHRYECCSDLECGKNETCSRNTNKCVAIECECGYIKNRTCVSYECCSNKDCKSGLCINRKCAPAEEPNQPIKKNGEKELQRAEQPLQNQQLQETVPQQQPQMQQQCVPVQNRVCGYNNIGTCRTGTQACQSNYQWGACTGNIDPLPEICDNKDNDCDGQTDEENVCAVSSASPVKVLVLSYFPLQGSNIDQDITGIGDSLSSMRNKVSQLTTLTADSLTQGSAYHGYRDSNSKPSLTYTVVDTKEFLKAEPVSTNQVPWNTGVFRPNYNLMLTSDVNICDYVDNKGVKEVWVWGYHYGNIEPVESNMAMGTVSRTYWNHNSHGDVSNSEQTDDLPTCAKSYVLYNYNYGRGLGEALENHGHHIEAVLGFVDTMLWEKFKRPYGTSGVNSCGWTHSPPNTATEYDWANEADALSNCEDWKPDGTGAVKTVDCHTWYGQTCSDNGGVEFKIWWMQNIPGKNNGLIYQGKNLKNWWDYIGDFDNALITGKNLIS